METLGKRIKTLREHAGLTQEDLAERMEVSRQAVSKWEADLSRPSTGNLVRLAALLDVGLDRLTGLTAREGAGEQTPEERPGAPAEADSAMESGPSGPDGRLPSAGLITPPAVRRARAFPWIMLCGALSAVFVVGSLILAQERGPNPAPAAPGPENTAAAVDFPERIPLTASPCRDFLDYRNDGDSVPATGVEEGLLLQYRFPGTDTSIAFYRVYAGSADVFGRPKYHLWAAYTLDGQSYTAMARLAEDDPAAGSPALSAYEALGFSGCRLSCSTGEDLTGTFYFALEDGVPQILFLTDDPQPREADVDADGESEILTLDSTGAPFLYDRGVDDFTAYALAEPLEPGWTLRHDGTDFYLDSGDGPAMAYHHLWANALTRDEVRGTDYTLSGLWPDVGSTVLTFAADQFSDGADPDSFFGRDGDGDPVPTHRQLAYLGLQTLYDLTGIRLDRCHVLATEFGVYYSLKADDFDRRSFYSFDRGQRYGGGELAVAGLDLTWNGEGTEWSPLLPEAAAEPEGLDAQSPERQALWAYERVPLLQAGPVAETGGGPGDDVRLYLEDGRFFEIATHPGTGLVQSLRGPYPRGFEH